MEGFLGWINKYRQRLIAFLVMFVAFGVVAWFLTPFILDDLKSLIEPALIEQSSMGTDPANATLIQTMVAEALMSRLALAAILGALAAVTAAGFIWLKRPVSCLVIGILFLAGLAFGRFFLLPQTLRMLLGLLPEDFSLHLSVWNYTMFCLLFELLLGVIFEEPVLVWLLYKLNMIDGPTLQKKRKPVYLVMLIVMAFLTPTQDALTLILSMLPLVILYEISALILIFMGRREKELIDGDA